MKMPDIKVPNVVGAIKSSNPLGLTRRRPKDRFESTHMSRILLFSIIAILAYILLVSLVLFLVGESPSIFEIVRGSMGSVFALLFAVIILDSINAHSDKKKKKREERRAIVRHNRIIQPIIDMYTVRKNMVITPNDKTIRKFQVNAAFTVKDMKDMFGPSELISDVGKSKIEVYAYYQNKLQDIFTHLVEDVDFSTYSELCDAAMNYINATSYGAAALDAVLSYQNSMTGTRSMRSVIVNMIRDEPEGGKFIDAPAALKNVYLLHQMINDQEVALSRYLKTINSILSEDAKETGSNAASNMDYE